MNQRVVEAINRQINSELSASYSYLGMSAWCERQKFTGAARWLRLQSQEEHMAGLGVALANGEEHIKSIADVIAATNNEDGVARAIREYVFQME